MKLVETLKHIWKIEELRAKVLTTLLFILIYRFGSYVVLPGIDPTHLADLKAQTSGGLLSLLDMFSGGAFSNASIFALGIMPYISASIVVQLLTIAVPYFKKMTMEGESGRNKMNQITRYLTVFILILQGPAYLVNLSVQLSSAGYALPSGFWFKVSSTIILTAGSMFVMWLGERMTDKGIGNGISILIMIGIIARFPAALYQEFLLRIGDNAGGLVMLLAEIVMMVLVIAASILLVQGTRKVPVQYARRVVGNKQYGGVRQYIPLKVNAAGVMPIIFAQAIMMVPLIFAGFNTNKTGFMSAFMDNTSFWYNIVLFILIVAFTYFYTAITVNPQQMAEEMKRNNGFIPGVKPGKKTADFIDSIMSKITLPGSIFLGIIAILPSIARSVFHVSSAFAQFYGGTSLLILVGVILDTLQQIESHLLMRHYDGVLEAGHIKGRMGSIAAY